VVRICGRLAVRTLGVAVDTRERGVVRRNEVAVRTHRPVMWNGEIGVIKDRTQPVRSGVTGRAGRGETGCNVIRNRSAECGCAVPGSHVAAIAVRRHSRVIVVDVALRAGDADVHPGQRKNSRVVVELAIHPGDGVVAGRAKRRRESNLHVVDWSERGIVFVHVAALARRWRRRIRLAGKVTLRALQSCVRIRQGEELSVIEGR